MAYVRLGSMLHATERQAGLLAPPPAPVTRGSTRAPRVMMG